eukprot:scaffold650099_cov36-Prasinocladus_malaysianus.AAC.1
MQHDYPTYTPRRSVDVGCQSIEDYGQGQEIDSPAKANVADSPLPARSLETIEENGHTTEDAVESAYKRASLSSLDWVGEILFTAAITALVFVVGGERACLGMVV